MILEHIAGGGAAQSVLLPRRGFLKGLVGLIAAPAVVKAESLMPIVVWRPTFHHARVDGITDLHLLACEKSDLLGVDLASLGLPPPIPWMESKYEYYWSYDQFPLTSLPKDKIRIPRWQQAELDHLAELAAQQPPDLNPSLADLIKRHGLGPA
jgi:hypothetical protein